MKISRELKLMLISNSVRSDVYINYYISIIYFTSL